MNGNSTRRVEIEAGGEGVVAHVGLHALGAFADRLGLGDALSARIPPAGERLPLHDRGKVLVQAMLMLAGGGESCADVEHLRAQERLFGAVASDSTTYRTFRQVDPAILAGLWEAMAGVRAQVWRRSSVTNTAEPVLLDIDATLVEVHSENKAGTAPTYKRGFGFHPMLCFADATGEALAARLRPGNAGANTVTDHLGVLDDAVAQLPPEVAAGHRPGDPAADEVRAVVVRADSAGCTHGFVEGCRDRNIGFAVVARSTRDIAAAISRTYTETNPARWTPARRQNGEIRDGAQVAELTDLVDLSGWPDGTRLIVRREPLHPGAQHSLFPSTEFRYWGHYTDQPGDPVTLDATMRAHAHVEDHIRRLKDSGLCRFPFRDLDANRAWLATVCFAADLVAWFQLLCLTGHLARAEPKTLRWRFWHAPARLVRHARRDVVRILDGWPDAQAILAAHARIAALG
ncbi:MAG: IS1380 family transposase [Acidimicrobiales bacterium]